MSETDLQRRILTAVNMLQGVRLWRQPAGRVRDRVHGAPKGTPDLCGYARGAFVALEVKTDEGRKRKNQTATAQREWHAQAERDGAAVFVVSGVQEAVRAVQGVMR